MTDNEETMRAASRLALAAACCLCAVCLLAAAIIIAAALRARPVAAPAEISRPATGR